MEFGFVTDRIAVGTHLDSDTAALMLRQAGITHVLNVNTVDSGPHAKVAGLHYYHNGTPDGQNSRPKPSTWFANSLDYAHRVFALPHHKLYVHCAGGIDRSTSTVYAILMAFGLSAREAEVLIRYKWPRSGLYYKTCAEAAISALSYK